MCNTYIKCDIIKKWFIIKHSKFFSKEESKYYFDKLNEITEFKENLIYRKGKFHKTPRKMIWYQDEKQPYNFCGGTLESHKDIEWIENLKNIIIDRFSKLSIKINEKYFEINKLNLNSLLINKYENGKNYVSWHSDNESVFPEGTDIISISFGIKRNFLIKNLETNKIDSFILEDGDIFIMGGYFQKYFHHMIPKCNTDSIRYNFTFRTYIK